jgi:hypothetical protein
MYAVVLVFIFIQRNHLKSLGNSLENFPKREGTFNTNIERLSQFIFPGGSLSIYLSIWNKNLH